MTRIVLDIDDAMWKVDHLARVMRSAESEFLSELAAQVDIQVTNARPLIVLDLDKWHLEGVAPHLRSTAGKTCVCRAIADQIEAQTKPARIPEPGLWGVVEASSVTYSGRRNYVRDTESRPNGGNWMASTGRCPWANLIDPTLIREGVTS